MLRQWLELQPLVDMLEGDAERSVESILAEAASIDVEAWLEQRRREEPGHFGAPPTTWAEAQMNAEMALAGLNADQPGEASSLRFVLAPTQTGWQVPALLKWGGFNQCPPPAVHVTFAHLWYEQWGQNHWRWGRTASSFGQTAARRTRNRPCAWPGSTLSIALT